MSSVGAFQNMTHIETTDVGCYQMYEVSLVWRVLIYRFLMGALHANMVKISV